jgi:AraC-like DNA-binding protein
MQLNIDIYKKRSEGVDDIIDSYLHVQSDDFSAPLVNIPDGYHELFFDLHTKKMQVNQAERYPEILAIGKKVDIFIIRFTPYGFSLLADSFPVTRLKNNTGKLNRPEKLAQEFAKIIFNEEHVSEKIAKVEKLILQIYSGKIVADPITKDISSKIILANGSTRLGALYDEYLLSSRQIESNFKLLTTLRPKTFAKYIRFTNALLAKLRDPGIKLSQLSYEFGYTDQSHFIKEFKIYLGMCPGKFFQTRRSTTINYL